MVTYDILKIVKVTHLSKTLQVKVVLHKNKPWTFEIPSGIIFLLLLVGLNGKKIPVEKFA
jgi:hypothetical protein